MDQQTIHRQIESLEAQVLSLRESLALVPAEQRVPTARELERVRVALAQLEEVLGAPGAGVSDDWPIPAGERAFDGRNELVWTTERTTRLYAINTGLTIALTRTQVALVVVEQALTALSADAAVLMLSSDDGTLTTLHAVGHGDASAFVVAADDPSPFAEAARTAQPVWIESPQELAGHHAPQPGAPWSDAASVTVVPLIAEGRVSGVIAFRYDAPRSFTIADRAFMLVLAQQCAAALERVHLYEQVRQAAALEERNRLARDLHDSVSQALYAIALAVSVGRANLTKDVGRVLRALDNIESLTGAAQADLRALLFDLRADSLSRTGLVNALLDRAQFLRLRHGLSVQTELCPEPALGSACKEALYGIAREALHNAAKHARASQVDLKLIQAPESLVLEIKDDGVGFFPFKPRPGHYGLQSMRERASELGAELSLETGPGQGTRLTVVVPTAAISANGLQMSPCVEPGGR